MKRKARRPILENLWRCKAAHPRMLGLISHNVLIFHPTRCLLSEIWQHLISEYVWDDSFESQ